MATGHLNETIIGTNCALHLNILWSAQQILRVPNVFPSYGDLIGTWAPRDIDANQFLEFQFATPVYVTKVDVYETYNAGGVKAIKCLDVSGTWITLWSTPQVSRIQSARIFSPSFTSTIPCFSNRIRLDIDCTLANTWVEIDAVRLHGSQGEFENCHVNK
ncbi:F-box/LRR-repeat protein 4-like [Dreissena polymorpha]|uniref:F-box/LRR-repeat protein 4-like n=1 Tax=Dreissena polymorpha TaxID=45954 RepID=UPI002264AC1D|nr:F-box/LRR-repeat protein 4-like [Dreissena polymorpha]